MSDLVDFLRAGGTLADLAERTVKTRAHTAYPNLVLFKYGIEAPWADPVVRECRGIVLDSADNWNVVCRAFDKFFNHGEHWAAEIDWSTARVQEKLDGSLLTLYRYAGSWQVATTGTPDACGNVHDAGGTFAEYFWKTYTEAGGVLPDSNSCDDLCFSFELMGPANRIVVVHEKPWLRLLAVRNRVTGEQYRPESFVGLVGIPAVQSFSLKDIDGILASFDAISPVSQEGYVVVDAAFNRIKIKHPGYVALHHAKDGMGPRAFVEIARSGETSEVIASFPEFAPLVDAARARYDALRSAVRADFDKLKDAPDQKAFAMQAKHLPYSAVLFKMRQGVELEEFLRAVDIDKLIGWMSIAEAV